MLNYSVTKEADAFERYFCKELDKCNLRELTVDEAQILMMLFKIPEKDFASSDEVKNNPLIKSITARALGCCTAKFDVRTLYMIICLCETMGQQVMYLYQCQYLAKKKNIKNVSFDDFCKQLFPHGFYYKEDMSKVWESCKVTDRPSGSDNLIDYATATYSIQFDDILNEILSKNEKQKPMSQTQSEGRVYRNDDKISVLNPPKHSCVVEVFYKSSPSMIHKLFYDASKNKFVTLKKFRNRTHKITHYRLIKRIIIIK